MAAKPKAKPGASYLVLRAFSPFAEGETLDAGALGDELEARIADGSVAPTDAAPAPDEPTATTVVGTNGTITATVL